MMFNEIHFADAELIYLFLVPVALFAVYLFYLAWRRRVRRIFGNETLVGEMIIQSGWKRHLKFVLIVVSLVLIAASLMRPQFGMKEVTLRNIGIDIAIVLDMSKSMKVKDIVPDRLTGAIMELSKLLDMLQGGRVALVPFAGIAYIQSPLTSDFGVIKSYMNDLRVTEMPIPGTAIPRGLLIALKVLGVDGGDSEKVQKFAGSLNKAVLLVTDGENWEGKTDEIIKIYTEKGIRIFSVGVGTPAGHPVPILDDDGKPIGTVKESDGKTPVISKLNEPLLREMADKTGGKYFHYTGVTVADEIYAELEKLEKKEFSARTAKYGEDRFQYLLIPAFILLFAEALLGERKRRNGYHLPWQKKIFPNFWALLLALLSCDPFMTTDSTVDKGNSLYAGGKYEEAKGEYEKAKGELPESPVLHNNLALAKGMLKQFDEAASDVLKAVELSEKNPEIHVDVLFNAGTLHSLYAMDLSKEGGGKKEAVEQWKKAAAYFEKAIMLDPQNADIRHNLEIAVMNGYPPCSKKDDEFEPNNYDKDAKFVEIDPNSLNFKKDLMLCPGDEDWFKIPLNNGEHIALSLKGRSEEGKEGEDSGEKETAVKAELLADDAKAVVASNFAKPLKILKDMTYFIRFFGAGEEEAPYSVDLQVIPECPKGDDGSEENDSFDSAKQVQDGAITGRICNGDDDWFAYTLKSGEKRKVVLQFSREEGAPLAMDIFKENQSLNIVGAENNGIVAELPESQEDQQFVIRVYSHSGENFYTLNISDEDNKEGDRKDQEKKQEEKEKNNQDKEQDKEKQKEQQKEQEKEKKDQQQENNEPITSLLDQIDRNPENLEAQEALRAFPFKEYVPEKDW